MKEITLDWDISFYTHKNSMNYVYLKQWATQHKDDIEKILVRKSSNGNIHFKIILKKDIDIFEHFQIRAFLRDDPFRLSLDLVRYYLKEPTNRLWDAKFTLFDKEIKKAGDWIDITKEVMEK